MDGAMGSLLRSRGLPAGIPVAAWNLEAPEAVLGVHRDYVEAGAGILLTNTFGASRDRLEAIGAGDRVESINRAGAELARRAASSGALVAGDMGPARAGAAEQAAALLSAGVDLLFLETFLDPAELNEAVKACRAVRREVPLAASMAFTVDPDEAEVTARVAALEDLGVDLIGVNCMPPDAMEPVVARVAAATSLPVVARPSAGIPTGDPPVWPLDDEAMAAGGRALARSGARIVGGCCGTTPLFIERLGRSLS